jgi:hypothetical protein
MSTISSFSTAANFYDAAHPVGFAQSSEAVGSTQQALGDSGQGAARKDRRQDEPAEETFHEESNDTTIGPSLGDNGHSLDVTA